MIPPSAAWGLVLNLAGVETRASVSSLTTQVRLDAPPLQLAIGELQSAGRATLYQQLHSYPVGNSGADLARGTHGAKYWIAPVRRELLVDLDALIGVRTSDPSLLRSVENGLRGDLGSRRYGLPFAGDNNFLFDHIDVVSTPPPTRWYVRVQPGERPRKGSCRLLVRIDRSDSSRTTTHVYAPEPTATSVPPDASWTWTPEEPDRVAPVVGRESA